MGNSNQLVNAAFGAFCSQKQIIDGDHPIPKREDMLVFAEILKTNKVSN